MIPATQAAEFKRWVRETLLQSGIRFRPEEFDGIYLEHFGLAEFEETGLAVVELVGTDLVSVKVMVLLPRQTCPEHRHRPVGAYPGKEETFRCQWGTCYLYLPGPPTAGPKAVPPARRRSHYTIRNEVELRPGDQYTSPSDTLHWFQAGPEGAVVWSFCSRVAVGADEFTDPAIQAPTQYFARNR